MNPCLENLGKKAIGAHLINGFGRNPTSSTIENYQTQNLIPPPPLLWFVQADTGRKLHFTDDGLRSYLTNLLQEYGYLKR